MVGGLRPSRNGSGVLGLKADCQEGPGEGKELSRQQQLETRPVVLYRLNQTFKMMRTIFKGGGMSRGN